MGVANSPHEAILDEIERRAGALDLEGLKLYRRFSLAEVAVGPNVDYPCLLLTGEGIESSVQATTSEEIYSYPVSLRILNRMPVDYMTFAPVMMRLRKRIRDEFQRKPIEVAQVGVKEVFGMLLQPSPTIDVEAAAYQLLGSRLYWLVGSREVRP